MEIARRRITKKFPYNMMTAAGVKVTLTCHSGQYRQRYAGRHIYKMTADSMTKGDRDRPEPALVLRKLLDPDFDEVVREITLNWTLEYQTPYIKNVKIIPHPEGALIEKFKEINEMPANTVQEVEQIKKRLWDCYNGYTASTIIKELIMKSSDNIPVEREHVKQHLGEEVYKRVGPRKVTNAKEFHQKAKMNKMFIEEQKRKAQAEEPPKATTLMPEANGPKPKETNSNADTNTNDKLSKSQLKKRKLQQKLKEAEKTAAKSTTTVTINSLKTQNRFEALNNAPANINNQFKKDSKINQAKSYSGSVKRGIDRKEEIKRTETRKRSLTPRPTQPRPRSLSPREPSPDTRKDWRADRRRSYSPAPTYCNYHKCSAWKCDCSTATMRDRNAQWRLRYPKHEPRRPCEYLHTSQRRRLDCTRKDHLNGAEPFYKSQSLRDLERREKEEAEQRKYNRMTAAASYPIDIPKRSGSRSPLRWSERRIQNTQFASEMKKKDYERRRHRTRSDSRKRSSSRERKP